MSLLGWLFGDSSSSSNSTQTTSINQDQRVQVGGGAGTLISPGAVVATPGSAAINASPNSNVTATITNTGFGASDVNALLDDVFAAQQQTSNALSTLATSLGSGLQAQAEKLGDIVSATKAPTQAALTSLLPVGLVLGVLFLLPKIRRKL